MSYEQELRWVDDRGSMVLQSRYKKPIRLIPGVGIAEWDWTEWKDVPVVDAGEEEGESP